MLRRLAIVTLALTACGKFIPDPTDDVAPGPTDGGADATTDSGPPSENQETTVDVEPKSDHPEAGLTDAPTVEGGLAPPSTNCASTRGPQMVELVLGGKTICIDSSEVTNAQYQPFIDEPNKPAKHPRCSFNTNYKPNCSDESSKGGDDPVNCIDWCDAWAFCQWAGKRLCGSINGGANGFDDLNDATKSQWFAACSKGGTQDFCYGPTAQNGFCQANAAAPAPVKSKAQCTGPYAGLFDLTGNVGEWEDSCTLGATEQDDRCRRRGGDIQDDFDVQRCSQVHDLPRAARQPSGGFRCCK